MKKALVAFTLAGFLLAGISAGVAGPPQDIVIPVMQTQEQYDPDMNLITIIPPFATEFDLRLTGNVLHGEMEYSPTVTDKRAYRFVLVNRGNGRWELRMGSVHYTSPYTGLTINEYWEGELILDADFNLVSGEFLQIGYCSNPNTTDHYPWAKKGVPPKRGLWCLGIRIYKYSPP